jgi:hypothetical protein
MTPLPLVFIPGMMCDARPYEHQIVSLSQRYPVHIASVYNKDSVREMAKEVLEHAPLCALEQHQLMHELIDCSRLEIIEDAGHLITLEQPEATTAAIEKWLEESID